MLNRTLPLLLVLVFLHIGAKAQDISIFKQFNGRFDYLAIGNTLNQAENNISRSFCEILPSSQATLNIASDSTIIAAYLYWAGSGLGDTEVRFNGTQIIAEDTYNTIFTDFGFGDLNYFSCYAEVTNQILAEGNSTYTLSGLDISETLLNSPGHCSRRTNFAGWSLYVIFENSTLPLNQVNLFQGLEIINRNVTEKTILLENVNVLDNNNAKIGFLAWEGDNALNFGESLSINGNIISNPPLNLADNAFNGTNTFTNSTTFYNADLDVYNIENNIAIGDTQVEIKLTTGAINPNTGGFSADLILINNIITVLNSQLPDATITIDTVSTNCTTRDVTINYTVNNTNCTDILLANTPIAIYAEGQLIGQTETDNNIPINGSENGVITINSPASFPDEFTITINVDDDGFGNSTVVEILETNNTAQTQINLFPEPIVTNLPNLELCNINVNASFFNLNEILLAVDETNYLSFSFYETIEDLEQNINSVINPENHQALTTPQTIFIKAEKDNCYDLFIFQLTTENCQPDIPEGFSPNNDGLNDFFNIQGNYTVFEKYELLIYSRYGNLVFKGNNNLKWYGSSNQGVNKGSTLPTGTYFYVIKPNNTNYRNYTGWVYLNR
jgi:gliding motility-associated-like protein